MEDTYTPVETYSGVRPLTADAEGIGIVKKVMAFTCDGAKLPWTYMCRPGKGQLRMILAYIPYPRRPGIACGDATLLARHGFRVDCRGTGFSECAKDDEYRPVGVRDGCLVIDEVSLVQNVCDG